MSKDEVELKFLNIDTKKIEEKLLKLGAVKEYESDTNAIFLDDEKLGFSFRDSSKKMLRLREINGKNILTLKSPQKLGKASIRAETECEVEDFEKTKNLFEKLGFKSSSVFSKKRKLYGLGDIHFEFDDWGWFPPFLEIETHSVKEMEEICKKLGLDISKGDKRTMMEIAPEKFK